MNDLPEWARKAVAEGRATVGPGVNLQRLGVGAGVPAELKAKQGKQSEAKFQEDVIDHAHTTGWRVAHFRKVRILRKDGSYYFETPVAADGKGFLDLELMRERMVKIELKVGKNVMTEEQKVWFNLYQRAGIEVYCFYPRDWPTIHEVLK